MATFIAVYRNRKLRDNARVRCLAVPLGFLASVASASDLTQLDPFAQATAGYPSCPAAHARMYTQDEARNQAHARVERGTRCAMEGTCEPGGAYRRDPEINDAVRAAIAADKRFANTAVWVSTSRKWVTVEGCVRSASQRKSLVELIEAQPRVERVFDSLKVR